MCHNTTRLGASERSLRPESAHRPGVAQSIRLWDCICSQFTGHFLHLPFKNPITHAKIHDMRVDGGWTDRRSCCCTINRDPPWIHQRRPGHLDASCVSECRKSFGRFTRGSELIYLHQRYLDDSGDFLSSVEMQPVNLTKGILDDDEVSILVSFKTSDSSQSLGHPQPRPLLRSNRRHLFRCPTAPRPRL